MMNNISYQMELMHQIILLVILKEFLARHQKTTFTMILNVINIQSLLLKRYLLFIQITYMDFLVMPLSISTAGKYTPTIFAKWEDEYHQSMSYILDECPSKDLCGVVSYKC